MNAHLIADARLFAAAREAYHAGEITEESFNMVKSVWAYTALNACLLHADDAADSGAPHITLVSA
jgi:hypothetical protein